MKLPPITPGPWKVDANPSFHKNRVWSQDMRPVVSVLSMSSTIAEVCPEAQANARAIAQVPDFYRRLWTSLTARRKVSPRFKPSTSSEPLAWRWTRSRISLWICADHGADKGSYCGYCGGYSKGAEPSEPPPFGPGRRA